MTARKAAKRAKKKATKKQGATKAAKGIRIHEQLNELVAMGERDRDFQIMCCRNWREFRDGEGIAEDLVRYGNSVFPRRLSKAQELAILSFPTEPLRLLRSVVIQVLNCPKRPPKPDPSPVKLEFRAMEVERARPSITVKVKGDRKAIVTFRAARIV